MLSNAPLSPLPPLQDCFQRRYQQLLQFFTRKTGNAEDARELTQDLWFMLQRRDDTQSWAADDPQAYMFTMARNLAIDHLRRHRLATEHADAYQALNPQEHAVIGTTELVAQRKVLEASCAALQALPQRTRDVFVAHRIDGVGHDDLAQRHGVTRSTIERDVVRATQAMQAVLAQWHASAGSMATAGGVGLGPKRRQWMGTLLGVGALAGSGGLVWTWWRTHVAQWQATLASTTGRQRVLPLPDGSSIALDAASQLSVAYFADRRQVVLERGSAFFDVVRAPDRPFVVHAGAVRVTVLGTRFSVEIPAHATGGAGAMVEVAVESGRVRVEPLPGTSASEPWPAVELVAGDVLRWAPGHALSSAVRRQGGQVAPWRNGQLSFRQAPLGEVIERLRRYSDTDYQISERAARLPITGEIRIAQAHEWLQLLPGALPVRMAQQAVPTGLGQRWLIAMRDETH